MFDHRVFPVDEGGQMILVPNEMPLVPFLRLLQDKAQPRLIALVLDAGEASSSTLEPHPSGLTQADTIQGTIGARRQRLGHHRLDVVGNPAHAQSFHRLVQGDLTEAMKLSQGRESARPFLLVGARDSTRRLPRRICPHLAQTLVAFRENRIVELAASFQVCAQSTGLPWLHHQRQFEQKCWRFLFWGLAPPGLLRAHQPHAFSCTRTSLPSLTGLPTSVKHLRCSCAARSPRLPKQGTALHPPDESRGLSRSVFCNDQTVRVWDVQTGVTRWSGREHREAVNSLSWSPDGTRLASGSDDHTVLVWRATDGNVLQWLHGHEGSVHKVIWSPGGPSSSPERGSRLASCGGSERKGELFVWDTHLGTCVWRLKELDSAVFAVAWGPEGDLLVSGRTDGMLRWWDAEQGRILATVQAHDGWV